MDALPTEDVSVGAAFSIGLDFSNENSSRATQITQLLKFANFELSDIAQADIVLGDGNNRGQHKGYVTLVDSNDDLAGVADHVICARCNLSSLMSAFSQAYSVVQQFRTTGDADVVTSAFVGSSDAAISVRTSVSKAAAADVTVLVTGESGTGKEVVARALHLGSARATGPFVPINCGAIPAELLESELFGHEKGAFTGAITHKTGRLELAHGGTLFLDEIGDLPFAMQVKLLRAIEQKSFERVGSTQTRVADVRIVAATHNNLEEKISAGEFREDLFYRLNVFPIEIPPLRERVDDLPLLISVLVDKIREQQGLMVRFSVEAQHMLAAYPWPGNVRELDNLLQRMSIQHPHGLVKIDDLPRKYVEGAANHHTSLPSQASQSSDPTEVLLPVNGIDLKDYLTRLERSLIEQALEDTNAVVARAADRLHIRRTTLVEKMRKHGLGRLDSLQ